ncbi:MAG: Crp/Fnr family transcriptional regulator [Acidimicrobiales bacterium]
MTDVAPTRAPFLQNIPESIVAGLRSAGTRRRFPAGASVFFEGDEAHDALLLLEGTVKVTLTNLDGKEVILDVLGGGSLVGELSAIDGQCRSATATTLTPVEVLAVPCAAFIEVMHREPILMYQLLVSVTGRLRASVRRQLEYGTSDALARLCGRLMELAEQYGQPGVEGCINLESPVSQADLAAWTGLSREAVVKALRNLRAMGWIENQGRHITINRPDELRRRSGT